MRTAVAILVLCALGAIVHYGTGVYERVSGAVAAAAVEIDPPLELPGGSARLTLRQRSNADVPGSGGRLYIHIGDITRGQTDLTLAHADGRTILPSTSVRPGDRRKFRVGETRYELVVVELINKLVGEDTAVLEFHCGDSETARIEALLDAMRDSPGLTFVRNGEEHDGAKAAAHLRRKWNATSDRVRTAEQFIQHLATGSSLSGKAYEIRLADGRVVPSANWLKRQLARFDGRHP